MSEKRTKKSESIEIRLSLETKTAFMQRCRADGTTASEAIRTLIDAGRSEMPKTPRFQWHIVAAAAVGLSLGLGVAAPALAHANQTSRTAFDRLDRNHDGVLSYREFRAD